MLGELFGRLKVLVEIVWKVLGFGGSCLEDCLEGLGF